MVYRKKREYIGGKLSIKNNNCDIKKYFVQKNSKLELRWEKSKEVRLNTFPKKKIINL